MSSPERKPGVLVVDDNPELAAMLEVLLRKLGCAVWVSCSGREALHLHACCKERIDVVLMDVRMPELDGPRTLQALRVQAPHVVCCFMSGDPGDYSEEFLRQSGAGFLRKPFGMQELQKILNTRHVSLWCV